MSQRYYGLSDYFKKTYGEKLIKLSIDGGFTCPNRDGTLAEDGCIFCSEQGSGEFSGVIQQGHKQITADIKTQIESQKALLSKKWPSCATIAYFQNYTNTYKPIEALKELYQSALENEGVRGLVIATRPDCVTQGHIELFKQSRVMWVELGLQTIHDLKGEWLRRRYTFDDFKKTFTMLKNEGIPVVVHLIAGIPGESKADFLDSVKAISALKPFGVKFHMLNVLKGTDLEKLYYEENFELISEQTYIEWICDGIEYLHPEIIIHRMTGDGEKSSVIVPKWILNKRSVLNGINKCLVSRDSRQGIHYKEKLE